MKIRRTEAIHDPPEVITATVGYLSSVGSSWVQSLPTNFFGKMISS